MHVAPSISDTLTSGLGSRLSSTHLTSESDLHTAHKVGHTLKSHIRHACTSSPDHLSAHKPQPGASLSQARLPPAIVRSHCCCAVSCCHRLPATCRLLARIADHGLREHTRIHTSRCARRTRTSNRKMQRQDPSTGSKYTGAYEIGVRRGEIGFNCNCHVWGNARTVGCWQLLVVVD